MPKLIRVKFDRIRIPDVRVSSVHTEEQRALMASTIREVGVVQDIVVRPLGPDEFELVAGKGRLEELQNQGATEGDVKLIEADEKLGLIMNIVENVARGTYEYISIARAIRKLRELGKTYEELEKIFPWSKRWIEFIEGLQDLPDDVTDAITAKKLTPTHVQIACHMPNKYEVHDALKTAVNLGWDTGTLRIFVENRLEQIAKAKQKAELTGGEVVIPPANPEQLIQYKQCNLCGYKKPAAEVIMHSVCNDCVKIAGYVTANLGSNAEALQTLYAAMRVYYGQAEPPTSKAADTTPVAAPE